MSDNNNLPTQLNLGSNDIPSNAVPVGMVSQTPNQILGALSGILTPKPSYYQSPNTLFFINSKNRQDQSMSQSDFTFAFNLPTPNTFNRVVITKAIIPKTFYNVASGINNSLTLQEGTMSITFYLDEANYTRESLRTTLISKLNQYSPNDWSYNVTIPNAISPDNGKYTFTVTGTITSQPTFIFDDSSLWQQMGFDENSVNDFVGNTLISSNVCLLQTNETIYIVSDCLTGVDRNILCEIYSDNSQPYASIVFEEYNPLLVAKPFTKGLNNQFEFKLYDSQFKLIKLNGLDWKFTFVFFQE